MWLEKTGLSRTLQLLTRFTHKRKPFSFLLITSLTVALSVGLSAQDRKIFAYCGALSQGSPHSEANAWFKEVELADFNNDGWLDIYLPQTHPMGAQADNTDILYRSQGDVLLACPDDEAQLPAGLLDDAFEFRTTAQTFSDTFKTWRGYDAEVAHLDNDNCLDIVRPDRGSIVVLWGTEDPANSSLCLAEFSSDELFESQDGGNALANPNEPGCLLIGPPDFYGNYDDADVADLDGDNDLDFAVAQYDDCGDNFFLENLGNRAFAIRGTSSAQLPAEETHAISFGDVDGDGCLDAALANARRDPPNFLRPKLYFGDKVAGNCVPYEFGLASPAVFDDPTRSADTTVFDIVLLNDVVGDTQPDLYIARVGGVNCQSPIVGHGAYFTPLDDPPPFDAGPCIDHTVGPYDARYADLDEDGKTEIITTAFSTFPTAPRHQIVRVDSGTLQDVTVDFLENFHGGIAVDLTDLDQDGDLDMVFGGTKDNESRSAAHVYENRTFTKIENRNLASGTFVAIKALTAGPGVTITGFVTFESSGTITLKPGFQVNAGVQFDAKIVSRAP